MLTRAWFVPPGSPLRHYRRAWVRPDAIAGLSLAAYAIPQVMAYATVAGVAPVVGIWAAVAAMCVYAILGSSRLLSVGPESTTALVGAAAVAPLAAGDPARAVGLLAALAVAVGLVCFVAGVIRLGAIADALSRPVLVGYLGGVAALMTCGQFGRLLGVTIASDTPIGQIRDAVAQRGAVNGPTLAVGVATLAALFSLAHWRPRWPATLLAVAAAAVVSAVLHLGRLGVTVVGPVPRGFPTPGVPQLAAGDLIPLATAAVAVALIAFADSIVTARAFHEPHHHDLQADTELRALGAANVAVGVIGGFPVSSSGSRTALISASGGQSQVAGLVAAACGVVTVTLLPGVLSSFPQASLGAVVVFAAVRLIDLDGFRALFHYRRSEGFIALAAALGVAVLGVLPGLGVAVGLSLADLLRRVSRPHSAVLGFVPGLAGMHDITDYPQARQVPGLLVFRWDSPLFFANAHEFRDRTRAALRAARADAATADGAPVTWFAVNAEAVVDVDSTAVEVLTDLADRLTAEGIRLVFARVKHEVYLDLERAGLVEHVGVDCWYPTLPTLVAAFESDQGRGARGPGALVDEPLDLPPGTTTTVGDPMSLPPPSPHPDLGR